ncbi:MAG: hypothetical protein DRP92_06800, partial [Candidatus Neomarinimicrobiota bacterium]
QLSGVVLDSVSLEPMSFVNVYLKNVRVGCATDENGYFSLRAELENADTLCIERVGYRRSCLVINPGSFRNGFIRVLLKRKPVKLPEVSIIGYARGTSSTDEMVLTGEVFHTVPEVGEVDVLRVLRSAPGVTYTNDFNAGLYVRGGGRDQNLIALDGILVPSPYHLFGIFSAFDADAIQFIKIEKSNFDPEFGSRLSSIMNINVRDGSADRAKARYSLSLISLKVTLEGPIPIGTYLVNYRTSYLDILTRKLKPGGFVVPYGFRDGMSKVVLKPFARHKLELVYYFSKDCFDATLVEGDTTAGVYRWGNFAKGIAYYGMLLDNLFLKLQYSRSDFKAKWKTTETPPTVYVDTFFGFEQLKMVFRYGSMARSHVR